MATFGNFWWFFFLMGIGLAVWRKILSLDLKAISQEARSLTPLGVFLYGKTEVGHDHMVSLSIQWWMELARLGCVGLGILTIVSLVVRLVS